MPQWPSLGLDARMEVSRQEEIFEEKAMCSHNHSMPFLGQHYLFLTSHRT